MVTQISDKCEPHFRHVVASRVRAVRPIETVTEWAVQNSFRLPCSDSEELDDDVLSVWAVRPLATAAPLGGAGLMDDCQLHVDSRDNVLSVGAWAPMNGPGRCCAQLDDFDGVVLPYEPDMLLPGRDMEVGVTDVGRDIDVFPVVFDETAAVPLSWPVVIGTGPQVGSEPDMLLSVRDVEVGNYGYRSVYLKFAERVSGEV